MNNAPIQTGTTTYQKTNITGVIYRFTATGDILLDVAVSPAVHVPAPTNTISSLSVRLTPWSLADGDQLLVSYDTNTQQVTSQVLITPSEARAPYDITRCPVCGEPLLPSAFGIGRCVNLTCRAMASQNVPRMLRAIGAGDADNPILAAMISRGEIGSVLDVFHMNTMATVEDAISTKDLLALRAIVHAVRGKTSLQQVLVGLQVPGWTMNDIELICAAWSRMGLNLSHIHALFDVQWIMTNMPQQVNWSGWFELVQYPINQYVLRELCHLLFQ